MNPPDDEIEAGAALPDRAPGVPPVIEHAPPLAGGPAAGTAAPVRRRGLPWLTLVLFLALAGGLYWVWTNPKTAGDDSAATDALQHQVQALGQALGQAQTQAASQLQALGQQVQTLGDRVDKVERQAAAPPLPPAAAPDAAASPAPAGPEVGDLSKKVDGLAQQLDALAARPAPVPAPPAEQVAAAPDPALAQLPQLVASLQARLDQALTAEKAARDQLVAEQRDNLDTLGGRVEKLEQGAGHIAGAATDAVKFSAIQAATVRLEAGEKLGPVPGAPPALARFAATPPPTEAALRGAFPAVAEHAREVSRPDVARESFFTRTFARLQQSVTVRQGDDVIVGDPAAGVLTRAETAVQIGDLAGAVHALQALRGPAAAAVHDWMDRAQALLAARAALAGMLAPAPAAKP